MDLQPARIWRRVLSVIALIDLMRVAFALEAERKGGRRPDEAIYEACLLRFRPIMMIFGEGDYENEPCCRRE